MTIFLYELTGADSALRFSPHCWKSRLALAHKQLNYETVPVRFTEKDKIAFSNQALLPVIQDLKNDGEVICDSWTIAEYIESQYPDSPSLFQDDRGKALAESINHWADTVLALQILPLIIMDIYRILDDKDKAYFRQTREQKMGASLEDIAQQSVEMVDGLYQELDSVRGLLSIRDYLGGQTPTYADISLMGTLLWASSVRQQPLLAEDDLVYAWYQRMHQHYYEAITTLPAQQHSLSIEKA